MKRASIFLLLTVTSLLFAGGTRSVIKVNGRYGIINRGVNQGVQNGQVFFVKRETVNGFSDVGEVLVIRVTANRAAVEHIKMHKRIALQKGDELFDQRELQNRIATTLANSDESGFEVRSASSKNKRRRNQPDRSFEPIRASAEPEVGFVNKTETDPLGASRMRRQDINLRKPWVAFSGGAMLPSGDLALASSAGTLLTGSYMVAISPEVNMGIEISQSFIGSSDANTANVSSFSTNSSSLLSATILFQRFFGHHFFVEGGGGMFRPKISIKSIDNQKNTYSSTYFGLVGGAGIFIPTSPYAGLVLKGRISNYFDKTNKHYLGITGGFRFKIR